MSRYRLEICKGEEARFISHLDFMRAIQRVLRRADIPVAFSEGFNPHPKISFGSALPVGVTSECELVDLELREELSEAELLERLICALPPGLKLNGLSRIIDQKQSLTAMISKARYRVQTTALPDAHIEDDALQALIRQFMARDSVIVEKRTKKGLKETDIRPGIFDLKGHLNNQRIVLEMLLQTGSGGNIRPEDVLRGLQDIGLQVKSDSARVHRTELIMS